MKAGLLHSTSLVEIAFDAHDGESDDDLTAFSVDVSALCTFAAGTGVSVAMLDLRDANCQRAPHGRRHGFPRQRVEIEMSQASAPRKPQREGGFT